MSAKKIAATVTVACLLVMAIFMIRPGISTNAQAPAGTRTLPYAGQLTYSGETAVDGAYDFIFSLYDAPEAGNLLWSEQQVGVAVSGGNFSTDLGVTAALPDSLFENQGIWLEVSLRGPGEADFTTMSPRQDFTPLATDALTCPHSHFGASWSGTGAGDGLYLINSTTGTNDGLHVVSYNTDTNHGAIYARNLASTGTGDAINSYSSLGVGLRAQSGGNQPGVYAYSTSGIGLSAASGANDGIRGTTAATGYSGIYGYAVNSFGVTGQSTNSFGMQGRGNDASGYDALGDLWLDGARGEILTGERLNLSSDWNVNIMLDRDNNDTTGTFYIYANGSASEVFSVDQVGNVRADGGYLVFSLTDDYGKRQLYNIASTEARYEDFGSAVLLKGVATVAFDPIFAETINTNLDYQVFLTPVCQEPVVLFVTAKTPSGFTVQGVTLNNELSNCSFDYRITAKRLGYETFRLDQMSTPSDVPTQ